ncbi:MAG TPA: hypothetical protein VFA10_16300 [Ktedonobacteraceae bacterium]|nr:hypothetical protein [Ktedonobacteraceae bacterium]
MFLQRAILPPVVGAAFITSARADQPRCAPIMHGRALQVGSGGRDAAAPITGLLSEYRVKK